MLAKERTRAMLAEPAKAQKALENAEKIVREDPEIAAKKRKAKERELEEEKRRLEFDAKREAGKERARREMCRRNFLPFVLRTSSDYVPGWVHKDICRRLETFSEAVADKESPRLIILRLRPIRTRVRS